MNKWKWCIEVLCLGQVDLPPGNITPKTAKIISRCYSGHCPHSCRSPKLNNLCQNHLHLPCVVRDPVSLISINCTALIGSQLFCCGSTRCPPQTPSFPHYARDLCLRYIYLYNTCCPPDALRILLRYVLKCFFSYSLHVGAFCN